MRLQKKVTYSIIFALVILFLSMFLKLIPCQTAPDIPGPQYNWKLCTLNPDSEIQIGIKKLYFGFSSSLTETYFITLFISFFIAVVFLHFIARTKRG